jgi:hypothetical protein
MRTLPIWVLSAGLLLCGGCVERVMRISTDPPGARIYVNGEERGITTPRRPVIEVPFLWYGSYGITVRKDGYHTEDVSHTVRAPPYQWVGPDLFAEILPVRFRDVHDVPVIVLREREPPPADESERIRRRDALLDRAEELQQRILK